MPWEVKTVFPVSTMWRGERKKKKSLESLHAKKAGQDLAESVCETACIFKVC